MNTCELLPYEVEHDCIAASPTYIFPTSFPCLMLEVTGSLNILFVILPLKKGLYCLGMYILQNSVCFDFAFFLS